MGTAWGPYGRDGTKYFPLQSFRELFNLRKQPKWLGSDNKLINKSNITPMLFGHTNYISSPEYPVIDIAVNNMMNTSSDQSFRFWGGIINDKQRATSIWNHIVSRQRSEIPN